MISFGAALGTRDVFLLTLDALRFDVAHAALTQGRLPNLSALIPHGFEARHTPATFTFPAHQAFFAGFFPTPIAKGIHDRPLALRFPGSRSTGKDTLILDGKSLIDAFAHAGYRTICIGGTGFFNPYLDEGVVYLDVSVGEVQRGRQAAEDNVIGVLMRAMPDLEWTLRGDPIIQGNGIAYEWQLTGTNTGTWSGIPASQQKVNIKGGTIMRVQNGKIFYQADYYDVASLNRQLGW